MDLTAYLAKSSTSIPFSMLVSVLPNDLPAYAARAFFEMLVLTYPGNIVVTFMLFDAIYVLKESNMPISACLEPPYDDL
jgi:hypothetical protein